jgi:hypothetical protein
MLLPLTKRMLGTFVHYKPKNGAAQGGTLRLPQPERGWGENGVADVAAVAARALAHASGYQLGYIGV